MKILLVAINAKYIHSCPAVCSLRAGSGHPDMVEIAEFTINDRYQDILSGILVKEADFIGFSAYIWNTDLVLDLLTDLRVLLRGNALLFAGGPEAPNATREYLLLDKSLYKPNADIRYMNFKIKRGLKK